MEKLFNNVYGWLNRQAEPFCSNFFPLWLTPNSVTYLRAILALPIIIFVLFGYSVTAIILYIIAGLMDYLDGVLARARKEESDWGKFIDPIADKMFICLIIFSISIALLFIHYYSGIFFLVLLSIIVIINIITELILTSTRICDYLENSSTTSSEAKKELKATYAGKIKMNLQLFGTGFIMLDYPSIPIGNICFWIGLSLLSLAIPFAILSIWQKKKNKPNTL